MEDTESAASEAATPTVVDELKTPTEGTPTKFFPDVTVFPDATGRNAISGKEWVNCRSRLNLRARIFFFVRSIRMDDELPFFLISSFAIVGFSPGKSPALARQEKMRSAVIEELLHVEKDFFKHLKVGWYYYLTFLYYVIEDDL